MAYRTGDWLEVVYATGLETVRGWDRGAHGEIRIRAAPALESLPAGEEHRLRVTVSPSDPEVEWRLFLEDTRPAGPVRSGDAAGSGTAAAGEAESGDRVWWRAYPGTWQPLTGPRQCVAEGRGRVRVNLSVRLDEDAENDPHLRLVAEAVDRG